MWASRKDDMKKLILAVAIISLAWFGLAKADSITPQEFADNLSQVPVKVQSFISSEIEKTKDFQKASWEQSQIPLANLKKLFIKN